MKLLVFVSALVILSGCTTIPSAPVETKVIVKVPCKIETVDKPTMPLDQVKPEADIFEKSKSAIAEIEIRKAYELKLETAVKSCQ